MSEENPSILSHVSIGTNNFEQAILFYDAIMETLGASRVLQHPGAVAYGKLYPEFWVQTPIDHKAATLGNGTHFGFLAASKQQVQSFFLAAMAHGATSDGEPGSRAEYGPNYYGCFVRDPDGHKLEATYWSESQENAD